MFKKLGLIVIIFIFTVTISAQRTTCSAIVETAINVASESCAQLGRNRACYGNDNITALDFENTPIGRFDSTGDVIDIVSVASLATEPLDVEANSWGIALLALQANLPETLPGQNVIFVVFGDTQLTNEVAPDDIDEALPTISAQATGSINIRSGPGTGYRVIDALNTGDEIELLGRNEAGDWAQFDWDGRVAWAYTPLLSIDGDINTLVVVEAEADLVQKFTSPMQAFSIQTGIGETFCEEMPRDGLLIQAPTATTVEFRINGIEVNIGSTALLRLEDNEELDVNTFEGSVAVTSDGETQIIEPGFQVNVSVGNTPSEPEPYDYHDVRTVPVELLPEPVNIPIAISSASPGWVDTGVELRTSQQFTLSATGTANICGVGDNPNCVNDPNINQYVGPEGNPDFEICEGQYGACPLMPGAYGALVARVGDGEAFSVGEGGEFIAANDGTLQFAYNDHRYDDNDGTFVVTIDSIEED